VVRKARYCAASNRQVGRHPGNWSTDSRHRNDPIDHPINGIEEFNPEILLLVLVPLAGEPIFRGRFVLERNVRISPPTEFCFGAASNVVPGNSRRFPCENASRALFDLRGPRGFNFGRVLGFGVIKARQEFSRQLGPLVDGPREGLPQNFLRS
jgi:hypothetical protein